MSNKTNKAKRTSSKDANKRPKETSKTSGSAPKEAGAAVPKEARADRNASATDQEVAPAPAGIRPADDTFFVPLSSIKIVEGFNSRKKMTNIPALAKSIQRRGLKQPLLVRDAGDGTFLLVAGERRYHAVTSLGWTEVKVTLNDKITQDDACDALDNLIENLQRENPDPYEQAEAFDRVMKEYGLTQQEIADETGISEPVISQRLALLKKGTPEVRAAVEAEDISPTHAREIVTLPDADQREIVKEVKERKKSGQKVTVRDLQDEIERRREKHKAEKDPAEADKLERVRQVREHYQDRDLTVRSKRDVLDQLGILHGRAQKTSSEQKKVALKNQIATLEWVLTVREAL